MKFRSGEMTANTATSVFEVPPTILKDHLLGQVKSMEMYFISHGYQHCYSKLNKQLNFGGDLAFIC